MGLLDEAGMERVIAAGCTACGGRTLVIRTYVEGLFPFVAGEPVGRPRWVYDGEKFIDGIYAVECAGCAAKLFSAEVCPRCHAEGGLSRALSRLDGWEIPGGCDDADCGGEEIRCLAFVPARVTYQGSRAETARSSVDPGEAGFHPTGAECAACGRTIRTPPADAPCPLCEAPGPLRPRP
jgi:hypothetical protein